MSSKGYGRLENLSLFSKLDLRSFCVWLGRRWGGEDAAATPSKPDSPARLPPLPPPYTGWLRSLSWRCAVSSTTAAAAAKTGSHSSELHLTRLLVYTANISTLERTAGAPDMWEDEKSQPAVKPKSNIWARNRRGCLSAVDSLFFPASIKSWRQSQHGQEIAPLVRGGKELQESLFSQGSWRNSQSSIISGVLYSLAYQVISKAFEKAGGVWKRAGLNFTFRHFRCWNRKSQGQTFGTLDKVKKKKTSCTIFPTRTFLN